MAKKARMGRPIKRATGKDLIPLGLRVPPEIKRIIDEGAIKSGRSQSQEAAFRIKRDASMEQGPGDLEQFLTILNLLQSVWGTSWKTDSQTREKFMGLAVAFFMREPPEDFTRPNPLALLDYGPMLERIYDVLEFDIPEKEQD